MLSTRRLLSTTRVLLNCSTPNYSKICHKESKNCTGVATCKKPAPEWKGTAVIGGSFEKLKSSSYLGKWLVL
jgi:hypothetical protein